MEMKFMYLPVLLLFFITGSSSFGAPADPQAVLRDAVAVWQMKTLDSSDGRSPLVSYGSVTVGIALAGEDLAESLRRGGNGFAAQLLSGRLEAGQGGSNCLQLQGSAFSLLLRFKNTGSFVNGELFSKHGGHTETLFNWFINKEDIGFEFGVTEQPRLAGQLRFTLQQIGPESWNDLIAVYDGARLELFLNGTPKGSLPVSGTLRHNIQPLTIGKAMRGQLVDQAAVWARALTGPEIAALSGLTRLPEDPPPVVVIEGPDQVIGDFSGPDWGSWTASGTAFGAGPRNGIASSEQAERDMYGTLTSPEFLIDRRWINFLIGGEVRGTDIRLLCSGETVRSALGGTPGALYPWSWNVEELIGKKARIEIRDFSQSSTRSHAFILASDIRLSNTSSLGAVEKELVLEHRFLNVPASHTGRTASFAMEMDGNPFRLSQDDGQRGQGGGFIPAANGEEGYWLAMDLSHHTGKTVRVRLENVPTDRSGAAERIYTSDQPHQAETLYSERLRPQFHFSPRTGWLNDPNGLVYHDGQYHLFFQHNALGQLIANQSWGHAVSRDLFHWEERPPVLEPYSFSKGRSYSGSAVIDKQNRAGFGANAMIAIYTDTGGGSPGYGPQAEGQRAEVIAYSLDGGETFTYYEGNPVYRHRVNGRDPKVIWWPVSDTEQTSPEGHWVMVVYTRVDDMDQAQILISDDLKNWTETDRIPDHYECVELFELPVLKADGQRSGESKWILQGGNGSYNTGHFDGRKFHLDSPVKQQTVQLPGYAWQRFNQAPDGRIIAIGWIRRHTDWEDMPFSQMMSLPLELTLRETPSGLRIYANPVEEMTALRENLFRRDAFHLTGGEPFALPGTHQQADLEVRFRPAAGTSFRVDLGADSVVWSNGRLNDRHDLPASPDGTVVLRIVLDCPLIEVIGNEGYLYYPLRRIEQGREVGISLSGSAEILECRLDRMGTGE